MLNLKVQHRIQVLNVRDLKQVKQVKLCLNPSNIYLIWPLSQTSNIKRPTQIACRIWPSAGPGRTFLLTFRHVPGDLNWFGTDLRFVWPHQRFGKYLFEPHQTIFLTPPRIRSSQQKQGGGSVLQPQKSSKFNSKFNVTSSKFNSSQCSSQSIPVQGQCKNHSFDQIVQKTEKRVLYS